MNRLQPKIPEAMKRTLFGRGSFVYGDSVKDIALSIVRWRYFKADGSPDYRYQPDSGYWRLNHVVAIAKSAMTFGPSHSWDCPHDSLSELSEFIHEPVSVEVEKGQFRAVNGEVYWKEWRYDPIFNDRSYDDFVKSVSLLDALLNKIQNIG
ncbi:hypothetical protein PQ455_16375 [Sphingomonas naphthae]|uniref:Uncharacterized protein n=1 Tax=Sphingomonas naphthae TaxID=1813468 RepID=A0ABY7TJP7_9SPHN|nr:hypothetical protein [Sphingomonas naphthae]WCT73176.1 hypothetical protein PQ455_16375 [Sphingomonas naphthae]